MSNVGRKPAHVGLHSPNAPSFIEIETWDPGKFSSNLLTGCHDCREGVRVFRGSLASVPRKQKNKDATGTVDGRNPAHGEYPIVSRVSCI